MTIKYPSPKVANNIVKKDLNLKANKTSSIKQVSKGMLFEHELNESNKYYLINKRAIIYKKPTPIQITKVEYPSRNKAKIVEAYYQTPSTTDYNGIYKGKYIDYEAKQTENLSFSFTKIFAHQIDHLVRVDEAGGIAFVIIYFKRIDKIYIIDIKDFIKEYKLGMAGGAKSIKASNIISIGGVEVSKGYAPLIDYLDAVDKLYFDKLKESD